MSIYFLIKTNLHFDASQSDATLSFASTTHPTMNPPPNPPQAQGKADQHFSKRTLRPAASLPTTAETYGEKHGIDPNLTLALQNIGRKGRQSESLFSYRHLYRLERISWMNGQR
jgi:hypothetical protein